MSYSKKSATKNNSLPNLRFFSKKPKHSLKCIEVNQVFSKLIINF